MISRKITETMEGYDRVEYLQNEAFPPVECYTMEQILTLAESEHIEYLSFWEEKELCGIMFYNIGKTMVYLFYLAVAPSFRSKGYGAKLLKWLMQRYPDKEIVGNIEPTGLDADNEEQRIRRLAFYERNGFHLLPVRLSDESGLYDTVSTGGMFDENEFMSLINELGFDKYHPRLIRLI